LALAQEIIDRINDCETYEEYKDISGKVNQFIENGDRYIIGVAKYEKRKSFETESFRLPVLLIDLVLTEKSYDGLCEFLSRAHNERHLEQLWKTICELGYVENLPYKEEQGMYRHLEAVREYLKVEPSPLLKKALGKAGTIIKRYGKYKDWATGKIDKRLYEDLDYINFIFWYVFEYQQDYECYKYLLDEILENTSKSLKKLILWQINTLLKNS
jgi:hypothetical protein